MTPMRPLFASDIDRTLHPDVLGHLLWKTLSDQGLISRDVWYGETISRARTAWEHREIPHNQYSQTLVDEYFRYEALKGMHPSQVIPVCEALAQEHGAHTCIFPRLLLAAVKHTGYFTVAISGSPQQIIDAFCQRWGFDQAIGSELHTDEAGRFTSINELTVRHFHDKAGVIHRLLADQTLSLDQSIAIGDSATDLGMLRLVEYPIAMNPSAELLAAARKHHIPVVRECDDGVIVMLRSRNDRETLEEVSVTEILPSAITQHMIQSSAGRLQ